MDDGYQLEQVGLMNHVHYKKTNKQKKKILYKFSRKINYNNITNSNSTLDQPNPSSKLNKDNKP